MQGILPYILRRLLWAPLILFAVSFITFMAARFGPGDPVTIAAGQYRDPEILDRVRAEKGLDKNPLDQYRIYIWNVLRHGDLGESYKSGNRTVAEIIFPKMWVSSQLGLVALIITFSLGIPVGTLAALRQGTWMDPAAISTFLFFQSVPVLVTVPVMLLVFVLRLHWLPTGGWEGIFSKHIIIPALALSLPGIAGVARLMRATTLDVLKEDYVRTARAKGLQEFTVVSQHVARNALLPMVTVIGISLVTLLEGAFFTETLMGIPGIGRLYLDSVTSRDYDVILGLALVLATAFIVANIVIDIAYTFIDPRVRLERSATL
jgi:ABC-type dipeptide/oligopeptide/nickel transport system permease component